MDECTSLWPLAPPILHHKPEATLTDGPPYTPTYSLVVTSCINSHLPIQIACSSLSFRTKGHGGMISGSLEYLLFRTIHTKLLKSTAIAPSLIAIPAAIPAEVAGSDRQYGPFMFTPLVVRVIPAKEAGRSSAYIILTMPSRSAESKGGSVLARSTAASLHPAS